VARPRLLHRLDDGLAGELTLVCAPAGFDKTSLLADWSQRGDRLVGWLSLDTGDNDPVRFWRHTVAALDRVRPGVTERLAPLLGPPAPATFDALASALVNELATDDGHALLVLDDYHLIEAQPALLPPPVRRPAPGPPPAAAARRGRTCTATPVCGTTSTGSSRRRSATRWPPPTLRGRRS
jgi:hypothetical protein